MYGLAMRLTNGDAAESQDIVHDAWMRAAERLGGFEWRSALRTWLSSIVINRWRESARAAVRLHAAPVEEHHAGGDDTRLAGTIDRIDLERAVAALAPGRREVLLLHDVEGYTHEEIAGLLGIEAGTSKSQLSRARAELRRLLEPGGSER